jgi:N-acylneuraminate cytidylyltransferase
VSFQEITAVVPIRKGSERIPGKNLADFATVDGKTYNLLEWKLLQLLQVLPAENVLVSSDWDEALAIAREVGANTLVQPAHVSASDSPFDETIAYCLGAVTTRHVAWSPVTAPLLGPENIKEVFSNYQSLSEDAQGNGLIVTHGLAAYALVEGLPINFALGKGHMKTQELPSLDIWDWTIAIRETSEAINARYMFGSHPTIHRLPSWATTDINDLIDLETARLLLPLYARAEGLNVISARALNESE